MIKQRKRRKVKAKYAHNVYDHNAHSATSTILDEVNVLDILDLEGVAYYIPCPKSPHGADVDPTGEYIVGSGKLASLIPVFSFSKMMKAIEEKKRSEERRCRERV